MEKVEQVNLIYFKQFGHDVIQKNPTAKVLYISSKLFLKELEYAINEKAISSFFKRYKSFNLLIIEDIEYLKDSKIYEMYFWKLLKYYLYDAKTKIQLVFSTSIVPHELGFYLSSLEGKFEYKMVANISLPKMKEE